jgi:hypothetical protein
LILCAGYPRRVSRQQLACDLVALAFPLLWLYGLLLGLSQGNTPALVLRNFAGMLFYLFYFILVCLKVPPQKVFKVAYWAAMYVMLVTVGLSLATNLADIDIHTGWFTLFAGPLQGGGATSHLRIFYANQMTVFIILCIALYRTTECLGRRRLSTLGDFVLLALAVYAAVFVPALRGDTLALMALVFLMLLVLAAPPWRRGRVSKRLVVLMSLLLLGCAVVVATGFGDLVLALFSARDVGNEARYEQFKILLADCTLFGKGLGAILESGYTRSVGQPHGFEMVYLNLFHKLGIFALLLIAGYLYTFYGACKALARKTIPPEYACCALGAMGYTIVAVGNPILLSPLCVLLHCVALYLLRQGAPQAHEAIPQPAPAIAVPVKTA